MLKPFFLVILVVVCSYGLSSELTSLRLRLIACQWDNSCSGCRWLRDGMCSLGSPGLLLQPLTLCALPRRPEGGGGGRRRLQLATHALAAAGTEAQGKHH